MQSSSHGTLSPLQASVLKALAPMEPSWTLSGGAALAGFHLRHRETRDLDLFWHQQETIVDVQRNVSSILLRAGFDVVSLRSEQAIATLEVRSPSGEETVVIDLVAEPVDNITAPELIELDDLHIKIDSRHEILVNKLCALLHRSELRDLVDIEALVRSGGDLDRGLADAPKKDGGFSPLTLGWVLQSLDIERMAKQTGFQAQVSELKRFRKALLETVAARGSA